MLRSVLASLKAWLAAEQAADPDLSDLAELGLQDPAVGPSEAGSRPPAALRVPLRLLQPLAPADSGWLEQAWMLLRAHGLELVPPATCTHPGSRRAALAACDLVVLPCAGRTGPWRPWWKPPPWPDRSSVWTPQKPAS